MNMKLNPVRQKNPSPVMKTPKDPAPEVIEIILGLDFPWERVSGFSQKA